MSSVTVSFAQPNTANPDFWVANNSVRAVAEDATHYYIGGDFTHVPLSSTVLLPYALPNGVYTVVVETPETRALQRVLIAR